MFPLTITKVDSIVFQGNVKSVNCPGVDGELTVLRKHAPLITPLRAGILGIETEAGRQEVGIEGGILAVRKNEATILL